MGNEFTRRGCIYHHTYRHLRLFYDYALLYKNFVEAGIIRILEAATDNASEVWLIQAESRLKPGKKLEPEPPHWITISFEQFRSYLIVGCMGEKVSEPTFKKHLKRLMEKKHIFQRVNPDPDPEIQNGPRQYLLNCKLVQKELDKQQKELDQLIQNLGPGTDEMREEAGNELIVTRAGDTPPGGVKDYPSLKELEGGKSLGEGQTAPPGKKIKTRSSDTPPGGVKDYPREDTKFRGGRIQNLGEGGYKIDPPITNSNYNTITDSLPSSPKPGEIEADSNANVQEEGEEFSPLSEHISSTDTPESDIEPTEARLPVVIGNGASSAINEVVTQANRLSTPPTIPHRPTGEPEMDKANCTPAKQARCDSLTAKLRELRGGLDFQHAKTAQEQAAIIRRLVATYSDEEIAWILVYTPRFDAQYRGVKPGHTYASILWEVAPKAMKVKQLATYRDEQLNWIMCYARHLSPTFAALEAEYGYAEALLQVAPDALAVAATKEVREVLIAHYVAQEQVMPPRTQQSRQTQAAQQSPVAHPYSGTAQLARQDGGSNAVR